MPEQNATAEDIRRLVALVAEKGLSELTIEEDGLYIQIKGAQTSTAPPVAMPAYAPAPQAPIPQSPLMVQDAIIEVAETPSGTKIILEAPMVGVFYRSPSPEEAPFVIVGDVVKVGQPIGLIEAMKVYSEVLAEATGRVTKVAAESGILVQQGQPLLILEPL